jgi:protein-disulfide isomerase-like protein with CxxC motif
MSKQDTQLPTFVLRQPSSFWWEVKIPVPTENDYQMAVLEVQFADLPQAELDKMRGQGLGEGEKMPTEEEICKRVVCGWRKLQDETGAPVPFSEEALARMLAAPRVRTHMVATFLAASSGMAARKNA